MKSPVVTPAEPAKQPVVTVPAKKLEPAQVIVSDKPQVTSYSDSAFLELAYQTAS
ncbi:hypothetical protein C2W64_03981 [Brevibacillus laterosporus]|nr:hypothetical protein [Brevibacillus laterosporus]RAP19390.1 hypothetical protein C2W64_03981 [Brevibacillus laterosporus]